MVAAAIVEGRPGSYDPVFRENAVEREFAPNLVGRWSKLITLEVARLGLNCWCEGPATIRIVHVVVSAALSLVSIQLPWYSLSIRISIQLDLSQYQDAILIPRALERRGMARPR